MKIYSVRPYPGIYSRHWLADDCGLKYLENYYSDYNGVNRWDEFNVSEHAHGLHIDFGGGCFVDEPMIEINAKGISFSFLSHQATGVYNCINCKSYKNSGIWRFNGRWVNVVIGKELRDEFLAIAEKNVDKWQSKFDEFCMKWKIEHGQKSN